MTSPNMQNPSQETKTTLTSLKWMPLDDIAQAWASFAQQTTNGRAFLAASAAFSALAQETHARQLYQLAQYEERLASQRDALTDVLRALTASSSEWQNALDWLVADRSTFCPGEEDLDMPIRDAVGAESYRRALYVAQLAVYMWQELSRLTGNTSHIFVGTLDKKEGTR